MNKQKLIESLVLNGMPEKNAGYLVRKLREQPNGCWDWMGSRDTEGVPHFSITKNKKVTHWKVHRLLWTSITHEILVRDDLLLAPCGCPNPAHRSKTTRGAFNAGRAGIHLMTPWKLMWGERIRKMPKDTNWNAFAREMQMSATTVRLIRKNKAWSANAVRA